MPSHLITVSSLLILLAVSGIASPFDTENSIQENTTVEQASESFLSPAERIKKELEYWKRPEGPLKIALQVGHLNNQDAPAEFPNLAKNTGAEAGGIKEVEFNLEIAERVKAELEEKGLLVELLPAVIPPDYYADLFVAIHADGSDNKNKRGFKASGSRFDLTKKANAFADIIQEEYQKSTGLSRDPNISRNMLYYYAFNWLRYEHSLHPMTVGIILETGFLTNPYDRAFLQKNKDKTVSGIVNGINRYITENDLVQERE